MRQKTEGAALDLSFTTAEGKFNYRVCALLLQEGKILAVQDERSPYYYLPGGRVQMGETAEQAVMREVWEELGVAVEIQRPLWLNQAFFTEDVDRLFYQKLCLYFLMEPVGPDLLSKGGTFILNEGRHVHRFTWLKYERLREEYFYPLFLKEEIFHLPQELTLRTERE